ncbi:MAG: hypothetical protein IAI48_14400, partial [Candidatus Eremiobacteraeota bacterium]|nr:hypothetical protein [Candidatus Eremiobacteraeota bacterium]
SPTPPPTATPPPIASPTPTAASLVHGATSPFARLAASVVRVYLTAVGRGDRESAVAELETAPSGPLAEEGVVGAAAQIRSIDVHGTGDVITVDVDLTSAGTSYAAQYTVERSPTGAALIAAHSIVKVGN